MKKYFQILSLILLCLATVLLIGLQIKPLGWILLGISGLSLLFTSKEFAKDFLLIHISIALLGLTRISTDISYGHMVSMGTYLILAVGIPFVISKFIFRNNHVRFQFHHGRRWFKSEIGYIAATVIASYFLLPFYLKNTGAYLNWSVEPGMSNILRFFAGTNGLGIWDELFFVSTVLGILRRYFKFGVANIAQAVLFTSFLYELGFTGWGSIMIYLFALIQGYIFKKTESLFYVIAIHLSLDFVLFLALIYAHHPTWMPIFIFK